MIRSVYNVLSGVLLTLWAMILCVKCRVTARLLNQRKPLVLTSDL
jgi:hypothetical protein